MAIQEYVYLADGQIPRAIDTMRDAFARLYRSGRDTAERAVGRRSILIVLEKFAAHFDQLAASNCVHVIALAQEWLKQPSRIEVVISMEHQSLQNMLTGWKDDPERLRAIVKSMQPKDAPTSDSDLAAIELSAYVNSSGPQHSRHAGGDSRRLSNGGSGAAAGDAQAGLGAQAAPKARDARHHGDKAVCLVSPSYSRRSAASIPKPLVSTCSASTRIRRFRWENNRLPSSSPS